MTQLGLIIALVFATGSQPQAYGVAVDLACPECSTEKPNLTRASSELKSSKTVHASGNAIDGKLDTAWCEGHRGAGDGQWLELELPKAVIIHTIQVHGGYFKSPKTLTGNARVKRVTLLLDGRAAGTFDLKDPSLPHPDEDMPGAEAEEWFPQASRWPVLIHPAGQAADAPVRTLRLKIEAVYPGAKYRDLCISEVEVISTDPSVLEDAAP